ncbi:SMEK domain-containing protein [Aliarcobacter lanthieri]|uniref:SMEK domain-containing protein n=1 Tax=Aliarcobacter lanthieri TaxID=1355374 RepID=UPI00047DCE6A|nr:SMEK domain-containing protein [Aliarcobacter lanthieri]
MNKNLEKFNYVKEQLIYLRTKVEIDNKLGLYDINNFSESFFSSILNITFDLKLSNINKVEYLNYPAIDLIDTINEKVFQVTSTSSLNKIKDTYNSFKKTKYKSFELNFFYIKDKYKIQKNKESEIFQKYNIKKDNLYDIGDILKIIEINNDKCEDIFNFLKLSFDTLSFEFYPKNYFDSFEPHLKGVTSKNFDKYKSKFLDFIKSDNKILEVYSSGGNGKSHLLYEFSKIDTEYNPLILKGHINILEDLKKLPRNKNFLIIQDDADRFLVDNILQELISYTIANQNIKLLLSYRKASNSLIRPFYRKYSNLKIQEIEIIWNEKDIKDLILKIAPRMDNNIIIKLQHQFNNNPYLITQAIQDDIESIKNFSLKIIDDTKEALKDFAIKDITIQELLLKLAITTPLHENNLSKINLVGFNTKEILDRLVSLNILRKFSKKYRFNPDIIGDLYLADYISKSRNFETILEEYLEDFSYTIFTNISYALLYLEDKETLTEYINKIIDGWIKDGNFSSHNLFLLNRLVKFIPEKSFYYLILCTNKLKAEENQNEIDEDGIMSLIGPKICLKDNFNENSQSISLGSIEPLISQLIYMLKNNYYCGTIKIKDILNYLVSQDVLNLPKPYYKNHELSHIMKNIFSPINTTNFQIIFDAIDIATNWLKEPLDKRKIKLFETSIINNLLSMTFESTNYDGIEYTIRENLLQIKNQNIKDIIYKVKDIVLNTNDLSLIIIGIHAIRADLFRIDNLDEMYKSFYGEIKKEFLEKALILIKENKYTFINLSEIDNIAYTILTFDEEKDQALKILKNVPRNDEYSFFQLSKRSFIIISYEQFFKEYSESKNKKDWLLNSKAYTDFTLDETNTNIIKRLSTKYKAKDIVTLLNSLDFDKINTYCLSILLECWFNQDKDEIIKIYDELYQDIQSHSIKNVLKEILLKNEVIKLTENNISHDTSTDGLKIYTEDIFRDFNETRTALLDKLIEVILLRDNKVLSYFINIITSRIYFLLQADYKRFYFLKRYIYNILEIQTKKSLKYDIYITLSLQIVKQHNELDKKFKDLLYFVVNDCEVNILEYELEEIYKLIDIKLEDLLDIIYKKLISKKKDGFYRYFFVSYMQYQGLFETKILSNFVKSYEDFRIVVDKTFHYYTEFVEYGDDSKIREIRIDLDWFFKFIIKKEYLEKLFNDLYLKKDIDKIKVFYKIVPISLEYSDLIIKNINLLNTEIKDEIIMKYLTQSGKIKYSSRTTMQNSEQLLDEEKLFNNLSDSIESFPLKTKIKEHLIRIDIDKKRELESDIEEFINRNG